MQTATAEIAVVILAGGEASRFPGKLESDAAGMPLLLRVCRNVRAVGPIYVSANPNLPASLRSALDCPIVMDRIAGEGPLAGLIFAFRTVREPFVFVVAGDAPFAGQEALQQLLSSQQTGDEAVVAENSQGLPEPLCALYDRSAFLREAESLPAGAGVVDAIGRLKHRRVRFADDRAFANVNTRSDLRKFFGT